MSKIDDAIEFGKQVEVDETPHFTYRPAGMQEIQLPDGSKGVVFTFTLHALDDNNMLVHTWSDGSVTSIIVQSVPMIDPTSVHRVTGGPRLLVPDNKARLIH